MKKKTDIVASVKTPDAKFYVRQYPRGYRVLREANVHSEETDLNTAIAIMLRIAYYETKQLEIPFV